MGSRWTTAGLVAVAPVLVVTTLLSRPTRAAGADSPVAHVSAPQAHTDHAPLIRGPFADGPSATRVCLSCHPNAAAEVMATSHWTWLGDPVLVPGHDQPQRIGKANLINNFCISVQSNWAKCTSCHAGYGWVDDKFDFSNAHNVDCLVCHDQSGTYRKDTSKGGIVAEGVDLLQAAKSVGRPTRRNCGNCHFAGGGGDAVKHGDLDGTLTHPDPQIDVHMGQPGFECTQCHRTRRHQIAGRSMSVSVEHANGVNCTDCHAATPHADQRLNKHTATVACQTCHIPEFAPDSPTKMTWDWSTAGQDRPGVSEHEYLKIKGSFQYGRKVTPEYHWYDGTAERYLLGDKIDPQKPTAINRPIGNPRDPKARIWPFKVHRGNQVYDVQNRYFLVPTTGGEGGFWHTFDWDSALRLGSKATGLAYSGTYGFAPTEMYWPLSHMVADPGKALQCLDCHSDQGRLDWQALGYGGDPARRGREPLAAVASPRKVVSKSTGELFSAQRMSDSDCNLAGKDRLARPFDVHAARLLNCGDCHRRSGHAAGTRANQRTSPDHLRADPRAKQACTSCHDPTAAHEWLPDRQRHFAALSCESCHVPRVYAAAPQMVDRTILTPAGEPNVKYRGIDGSPGDPRSLVTGYRPLLLPLRGADGRERLAPQNVTGRWHWVAGDPARPVNDDELKRAILVDGRYQPEVLAALDADKNGTLESEELRLDTPAKVEAVRSRLVTAGLGNPRIEATVEARPIHHTIVGGDWAVRDCNECHDDRASRLEGQLALADYLPADAAPMPPAGAKLERTAGGGLVYRAAAPVHYVVGQHSGADAIGLLAVAGALAGVLVHGGLRLHAAFRLR